MACPGEAELIAYAVGQLQGPQIAAVASHLRQCRNCRKRVQDELRNESLLIQIKSGRQSRSPARPVSPAASGAAPEPAEPPAEGTSPAERLEAALGGRYKILERVGEGGAGRVFRAYDTTLHRQVAVKHLLRTSDDDQAAEMLGEARTLARMNCPAIVQIHEVLQAEGRPCLVMEWVEGASITQALAGATLEAKVRVLLRTCEAVAWAHQRGILHRDLKPSNVLVSPEGAVKVVDFHLASRTAAVEPNSFLYRGTPMYSAPEQFIPGKQVGPGADVFALGVIFYEVLTGQHPFMGRGRDHVIGTIMSEHPDRPAMLVPDLPIDLENITLKALEKDPALRYPDARAMVQDLQRHLSGQVVWARPSYVSDRLQSEIAQHLQRLEVWSTSGYVTERELDRLHQIYEQVLAPKEMTILDARQLSLPQVCLYLGAWITAIAALLLVLFEWKHIAPAWRPVPALAALAGVTAAGLWLWRRGERRLSVGFLVASNLLVPMAVLATLFHWNLLTAQQEPPYEALVRVSGALSNVRLLAAGATWLAASVWLMRLTRSSVATALACVAWLAMLSAGYLLEGMAQWGLDAAAGRYLWPGLLLVGVGVWADRRRLLGYAWPPALVGTVLLVGVLAGISASEQTLLGWVWARPDEAWLSLAECRGLSFIISGAALLGLAGGFRAVGTRLYRRLAEGLNWVGSLFVLVPLRALDDERYRLWWLYEKLLPAASLGFVFASVPRQMKPFFFAGLLGLLVSIQRLTVRHFADHFWWPVTLILVGLGLMVVAWAWPRMGWRRPRKGGT